MVSGKDFGRNTSFCGVIKKVLENAGDHPISCEEIAAHAVELWGRGIPVNPYEDVCLVYVFVRNYFDVEEYFDEVEGDMIMVDRLDGSRVPVSPDLLPLELNSVYEQIKRVKFRLCE